VSRTCSKLITASSVPARGRLEKLARFVRNARKLADTAAERFRWQYWLQHFVRRRRVLTKAKSHARLTTNRVRFQYVLARGRGELIRANDISPATHSLIVHKSRPLATDFVTIGARVWNCLSTAELIGRARIR
jgi:hypothetical protein